MFKVSHNNKENTRYSKYKSKMKQTTNTYPSYNRHEVNTCRT